MLKAKTLFAYLTASVSGTLAYDPYWDSLDTRPLPDWYDKAKIGISVHWGVYSVPSHASEWFWWFWQGETPPRNAAAGDYVRKRYHSAWTYADFAPDFTAEFFYPKAWAELFRASGAKYVLLTAKHHDGFALWPSPNSFGWNSMDVGPRRDLVGDLAEAVKGAGLRFGVHYSLYEWFNGLWRKDRATGFAQNTFSMSKVQPELRDLVLRYRPDVIWVDGENAPASYWNSTNFLAWLYNESPVAKDVVVNDRWGAEMACKHGDFYNCGNKFNPGHLYHHKFENVFPLDKDSWGYRRTMNSENVMSIEELLTQIVSTITCNGNVLINIGARKDGTIPTIFEERLRQMGRWLFINQEAVFGAKPWLNARDSRNRDVWYATQTNVIYVFVTKWPGRILELATLNTTVVRSISKVEMLGVKQALQRFVLSEKGLIIEFPCVACAQPVEWVWVLKLIC